MTDPIQRYLCYECCIGNDTGVHVVNKVTFLFKNKQNKNYIQAKCSDLAKVKKQTLMFT